MRASLPNVIVNASTRHFYMLWCNNSKLPKPSAYLKLHCVKPHLSKDMKYVEKIRYRVALDNIIYFRTL